MRLTFFMENEKSKTSYVCQVFIMPSDTTVFKSRYVFPVDHAPLSPGFISVRDGVIEKNRLNRAFRSELGLRQCRYFTGVG